MKRLVALFEAIDTTTSTKNKVTHLAEYFRAAPPADAIWTLYYFLGRKQKRLVKRKMIQEAVQELSGLPDWLFEESYSAVGDLAETIALLTETIGPKALSDVPLHIWVQDRLPSLSKLPDEAQKDRLKQWWRELSTEEVFILTKLLTGGFRSGVSERLVIRGLVEAFQWDEAVLSEKLIGDWPITDEWFLTLGSAQREGLSLYPYPFFLASPTDDDPGLLGDISEFAVEWKWDGIRSQIVKREGQVAIWSRGEELISQSFPELIAMAGTLPDGTVLDGEILAYEGDTARAFANLQKRLQRKKVSDKMVKDNPVVFFGFDCLQWAGLDLRDQTLKQRRETLDKAVREFAHPTLRASHLIHCQTWADLFELRKESRSRQVEGLMLKRWNSVYQMGRKKGDWWKWKIDPMTLDAVMLYAQAGHGKRANLYTDYTFGLWKDQTLVPFAKAYSGLSNEEINKLDAWIRKHTLERFGPVRSVMPLKVFEIAFEGIALSPRHKAGIAVRFPRILRERLDKKPEDADSLASAMELLNAPTVQS
ncbi:MAG: ATP-dependent DNA ligase [Chitinophagaceae bacterium]|nr:ATP-dependent DNA ligase [Oligoflexus sp.]